MLMTKNKLEKIKISVNKLDDNSSDSSVLDTQMAIMYKLSNMNGDIADVILEQKRNVNSFNKE
jgi:hypothetical protein